MNEGRYSGVFRVELPKRSAIAVGCFLVFAIGVADYLTGYKLGFAVFYLLPIAFMAWYAGQPWGVLTALASFVAWYFADSLARNTYPRPLVYYWNSAMRLAYFLVVAYLVRRVRASLDKEKKLARLDHLTRVPNSRAFTELAEREIARVRRHSRPLTMVYIDIDNFKKVNDEQGHSAGDELLRAVASCIKDSLRATDVVARLGGDEFAALLPETDKDQAREVVDRMQTQVADRMKAGNWPVTLSVGAVTYAEAPDSVDELLRRADKLMYAAKRDGKGSARMELAHGDPAEER